MAEQSSRILHQDNPPYPGALPSDPEPSHVAHRVPSAAHRDVGEPPIRACFAEGVSGPLSLLEVEVPVSWDVKRLPRALFALRLQVVSSERRYARERVMHRLRVVEFDGAPIRATKRSKLIPALLSLLDGTFAKRRP